MNNNDTNSKPIIPMLRSISAGGLRYSNIRLAWPVDRQVALDQWKLDLWEPSGSDLDVIGRALLTLSPYQWRSLVE